VFQIRAAEAVVVLNSFTVRFHFRPSRFHVSLPKSCKQLRKALNLIKGYQTFRIAINNFSFIVYDLLNKLIETILFRM